MNPLLLWTGVGAALIASIAGLLVWRRRRQYGPRLRRQLALNSDARLRDVVIPDGLDGHIQVAHLLRTGAGFVVVDVVKVGGAVFGGDTIDEWTALVHGRGHKFRNPVAANQARVLAVRQLVPRVPVHGLVVLLGEVSFPKGTPARVATLDTVAAALQALPRAQPAAGVDLDEAWYGLASAGAAK